MADGTRGVGIQMEGKFLENFEIFRKLGCGLACHVGYDQGIPSIGIAKNFTRAPLLNAADGGQNVEQFEQVHFRKILNF